MNANNDNTRPAVRQKVSHSHRDGEMDGFGRRVTRIASERRVQAVPDWSVSACFRHAKTGQVGGLRSKPSALSASMMQQSRLQRA